MRWRIFKPDPRTEVEEELAFHLEQRVRENIARGMDPETARAAAQHRLGDLQRVRSECTRLLQKERRSEARNLFMKMSWLDFKLGFRMLIKYPGLTVIGGLAIALAIAVGALAFEINVQAINPRIPLPGGDRMVAIQLRNAQAGGIERQALHDFLNWRGTLRSIDELGAYRDVDRNLITAAGRAAPIRVAEITASAFRIARVKPLLGRTLDASDEQPGAPPVLVLGERIWRSQFSGDSAVVGQTVRLGRLPATVVGVLPENYGFPMRHRAWTPLRVAALNSQPSEGSPINIFGRLASGASLADAQAELGARGQRAAADFPATHQHLRPEVISYPQTFLSMTWQDVFMSTFLGQSGVVLFLILVCTNVATLVFARTATRESELVVRSALGASRSRIVTQILAETLVLGGLAALVALSVVSFGLRLVGQRIENAGLTLVPFWVRFHLAPTTILYAVLLTFLAALIIGVVPALKVTRRLADRLRQAAVGGADLKFGKVWTGLIVTQVTLTVLFLTITIDAAQDGRRARRFPIGFPANEYVTARLAFDREAAVEEASDLPYTEAELAHYQATLQGLQQRLAADPVVSAVTYAINFPGDYHTRQRVEVDGPSAPSSGGGHIVQKALVGVNYFQAFDVPVLSGRRFYADDIVSSRGRATGADELGASSGRGLNRRSLAEITRCRKVVISPN